MKEKTFKSRLGALLSNKYAIIVLVAGLVLLLLPSGGGKEDKDKAEAEEISAPAFSLEKEEERLASQLSRIKGAGEVSVLLSVEGSARREPAVSGEELLVISEGSSEKVVDLYYVNPAYMGAVIVCRGADLPAVRLEITRAVSAFTGLGADSIRVIQME